MTLPPIHDWWPHLSIDARHDITESRTRELSDRVREEIREITGAVVGEREHLSDEDLDYARTQVQAVD